MGGEIVVVSRGVEEKGAAFLEIWLLGTTFGGSMNNLLSRVSLAARAKNTAE